MDANWIRLDVDAVFADIRPLPGDKWLIANLLHKSIRRGETSVALQAGYSLRERDRKLFWRKLRAIAIQDIGIGNLPLVYEIGSRYGDEGTALRWVQELAGSVKCTAPFDQSLIFDSEVCTASVISSPNVQGVPLYAIEREVCSIGPACIQALKKAAPELKPYTVPQIGLGLHEIEGGVRDRILTSPRLEAIAVRKRIKHMASLKLTAEHLQIVRDVLQKHWQQYQDIRAEKLPQYLSKCVWRI